MCIRDRREMDVSSINLFGGIPDEDASGKSTESTWLPPQEPQAMSTPITEIPKSTPTTMVTQDRVPLLTPMILVSHPKEGETSTSSSTLSDPSVKVPLKKINSANVRATSSVSSLEEGEGIVNNDEYERAIRRMGKINKKIVTLIKNWNEESKTVKASTEVIEIDLSLIHI